MLFNFTIADDACAENKKKIKSAEANTEERNSFVTALYWKYSKDVYSYVLSRCPNQVMAEDIFQEAWFTVFKSVDRLEKKSETVLKSFIFKTANNRIKHLLSEERKLRNNMVYDLNEEIVDDTDLFEQCESHGVERVLQCFEMLSAEQNEVLRLYYLRKMSLKDIAQYLNLSESAVNSRWCRGRKKLIELLKERGFR